MSSMELATAWVKLVPSVDGISDQLTKAFLPGTDAAGKEGDKAGGKWGAGVKKALGAAAIGAAAVAAFKGLYEVGAVFDDVTDTIRVGTGAQGVALDGLVASAKNVGTRVPAEFQKIGSTIADLNTRFGLSGSTLETVAAQYLEAGRILGEDVDINKTSAAFSAFKIEGDGVIDAMDTLFQVSQATGVGMNELAAGVQANAPALQNLGFGFEESIALMGTLDKAGLNSTAVMASMSKGLVTLAKDGEKPEAAFKRVTGEIQSFVDTGDTAAALDLASQIFGTRGASQFVGALQSGVVNMEDLMAATGATGDTIIGVGEETSDFAETWQVTMNTAMVAIEPLATAVFTAISDGLKGALPFLQDLGRWVSENTGAIGIIAAVIGGPLVAAFVVWTTSVWLSTIALLASPITWIVVGIIALIAGLVALVLNWDTVVAFITEIWSGFVTWITEGIALFSEWWAEIWAAIIATLSEIWEGMTTELTNAWSVFTGWLQGSLDAVAAWWNSIWAGISATVTSIWAGITGAISGAIGGIRSVISSVLSAISTAWKNSWQGMSNVLGAIFGAIAGVVKAPINGIISIINAAINGLNSISVTIPDWVPFIGGSHWGLSLPTIPMLAKGATVLPKPGGTLAILAEAGKAETVVDEGLMNRALEEGLSGNADSSSGVKPGTHMYLVVDGRKFTAFMDERAEIVTSSKFRSPQSLRAEFAR